MEGIFMTRKNCPKMDFNITILGKSIEKHFITLDLATSFDKRQGLANLLIREFIKYRHAL